MCLDYIKTSYMVTIVKCIFCTELCRIKCMVIGESYNVVHKHHVQINYIPPLHCVLLECMIQKSRKAH